MSKKTAEILRDALLGAAVLFCSACPAGAGYVEEGRTVAHNVAQRLNLQTELPQGLPMREENRRDIQVFKGNPVSLLPSRNTASFLLWISLAVIVLVVLANLRGNLWSFSRSRRLEAEARAKSAPDPAAAARMEEARVGADELAVAGSYAEAMHVLLLQSVDEMRRRMDMPIAASLTSREILRAVGLSEQQREHFADIMLRVEISYFGGHQPEKEEYLACRRSFEALSDTLRQGRGTLAQGSAA